MRILTQIVSSYEHKDKEILNHDVQHLLDGRICTDFHKAYAVEMLNNNQFALNISE